MYSPSDKTLIILLEWLSYWHNTHFVLSSHDLVKSPLVPRLIYLPTSKQSISALSAPGMHPRVLLMPSNGIKRLERNLDLLDLL